MVDRNRSLTTNSNVTLAAVLLTLALVAPASVGFAAQGDCNQPVSTGPSPTATDCLFILQAAVGAQTCTPECICAPSGNLPVSATNALYCLTAVVSPGTPLLCPCTTTTSSTSTTLGATTTTTLPPASTTTLAATTTTTLEQCPVPLTNEEADDANVTTTPAMEVPPPAAPCHCVSEFGSACTGTCPQDAACLPDFDVQECYCQGFGCGQYEADPQCYGLCDSGEACVQLGEGCDCAPIQGLSCGATTAPSCDGACPSGQFCHQVGPGCGCVDVTCGSFEGPPRCLGVCPPGTACADFGGTCGCAATVP